MGDGDLQTSISEVAAIDALHDLAQSYKRSHGRAPIEISHWDPSDEFIAGVRSKVTLPALGEPFRYRLSFEVENIPAILGKFGRAQPDCEALITENGTNAILAAANALALAGVQKVAVLSPCYFAIPYALSRFGIAVRRVYWERKLTAFVLPAINLAKNEALWIEASIFGTGVLAHASTFEMLNTVLSDGHMVVVDEALAPLGSGIASKLRSSPGLISIHAPHKAVSMNGLKFGAVVFDASRYDTFDHWADILGGGLSLSAIAAAEHFLSPAFDCYAKLVEAETRRANTGLSPILASEPNCFETDHEASGHWRMIYFPGLPADLGSNEDWTVRLLERTGALVIPGIRAGCDPAWGFCFRVNLLRYGPQFRAGLRRLLEELSFQQRLLGRR